MGHALGQVDMQGCELCSREFPIETMEMHDDSWVCPGCGEAFRAAFAACPHDWTPHVDQMGDPGQYCTHCTGFVRDEDMHLIEKAAQR